MPSHVETLLTSLGVPSEDAAKIVALPEAEQATFDAKPYAEKVEAGYKTKFENDPTFFSDKTIEKLPVEIKKKLESAQFGRAAKVVTDKLLKGLGMTEADFADLPDEQKEKIELLIPAIAERWTKTRGGKDGDKQLQQDLIDARKQLEKYGPDYEKGVENKYETQAEQKVTSAVLDYNVVSDLSSIPNFKINAVDVSKTATEILISRYGYARVGNLIELRKKENPEMKVLKPGSSQELTLKEALTEIATERGWIEKEKESGTGGGTVAITPQNGVLQMVAPHLQDKISKKIAEEAK